MAEATEVEATEEEVSTEPLKLRTSLVLEGLCFTFEDSTTPTIENLSMEIRRGERVGIRGASGVGKTTLFNLLLGLYKPTAGRILVDGEELTGGRVRQWQNNIGYVSQQVFIGDMTLAENIALGVERKDIDLERLAMAIERADLRGFVESLPEGVESHIGEQG
jgi:ABC-type bacteriocin/lantibiotic exporter with double-glycine peptidase domain